MLASLLALTGHLQAGQFSLYALSLKDGVLLSENGGRSWKRDSGGLPDGIIPLKIYVSGGHHYLTTFSSGLYHRERAGDRWEFAGSHDFRIRSQYSASPGYRKISAFAVDPSNPLNILLATKHTLYRSRDGGKTWSLLSMKGLNNRNYITALEIQGETIYAGTSFNGFFYRRDGRFETLNRGLPQEPYSGDMSFKEEMTSIHKSGNRIYTGFRFGGRVCEKGLSDSAWKSLELPQRESSFHATDIISSMGQALCVSAGERAFYRENDRAPWKNYRLTDFTGQERPDRSMVSITVVDRSGTIPVMVFSTGQHLPDHRSAAASGKKALYASVWSIQRKPGATVSMMKRTGLNAIVIDMKDDFGNIYYPTEIRTAHEIGAARRPIAIGSILKQLHENGIYAIARIVVFKDERLFKAYNSRYAIRDRQTGAPWRGNAREYWIDAHSEFAQDYNISIAKELQKTGFDEIQFDYIRFPSDGPTGNCSYTFRRDPDIYKSEILCDFLRKARKELSVPVSTDIYGFNSWYSFGNWIGQNMEEFGMIVDAICPMVYPSHFGNRFYSAVPADKRPYSIVYDGGIRAHAITGNTVVIRPYLQAFKLMAPTWGPGYISSQVHGAEKSGCSGFIFWNAKGEYAVVEEALTLR
jgi:hypothetical protein